MVSSMRAESSKGSGEGRGAQQHGDWRDERREERRREKGVTKADIEKVESGLDMQGGRRRVQCNSFFFFFSRCAGPAVYGKCSDVMNSTSLPESYVLTLTVTILVHGRVNGAVFKIL